MIRLLGSPETARRQWFPQTTGFRDRQEEALSRIWNRESLLVLMPTGTGKSLVYQLPVLSSNGIGIVVSPLIALMEQQTNVLRQLGVTVLSLGGSDALDAQAALQSFPWTSAPCFIFVSPERLESDGYLEHLVRKHRSRVALIVIDEAHCISQWGHDFRPPYKAIPGFLDRSFGRDLWPTLVCLTATLDIHNQAEILGDFRLSADSIVRSENMLRTNLDLSFQTYDSSEAKLDALEDLLSRHADKKLIVYTHLKQNKKYGTRALAKEFSDLGYACAPFDADLPMRQKEETLRAFSSGDLKIVFATGAFGMGIDIPDIRGVVHFLLPESLEQYYQEVGRAGRDGIQAFGVLMYTPANARVRRDMIRKALRSATEVEGVWREVCQAGRSSLRTVSPWAEFQGREDEHALFYAFQRIGALTVVARGPGRLSCFEPRGPDGAAFLNLLLSATRTGNTAAAIRSLALDPSETIERLFTLYDERELKLIRSPDKTFLFETRELEPSEMEQIVHDISSKVEKRLEGFEEFVKIIETGSDPSIVLHSRFGIF